MQDTSTNLSKLQREHLLDICSKIKKQEPVEIVEIAELEQFIKSMKYGLNFEKHEEPVDRMLRTHIPVFKEFKEVINNPESADCNFLLEGDNLHSLKLLEKTHKGRIDVCYLDPPYNTLNEDFAYGDKMLDENDGFVHSKWLSFMKERLEIARKLLTDTGVLFISIDDNELYQLKLLCDSLFGSENFIASISVKTSSVNGFKIYGNKPVRVKDYVLIYAKDYHKAKYNRIYIKKGGKWDTHYNLFYDKDSNEIYPLKKVLIENGIMKSEDKLNDLDINNSKFKKFYLSNCNKICQTGSPSVNLKNKCINDGKVHKQDGYYLYGKRMLVFLNSSLNKIEGTDELGISLALSDLWTDIDYNNIQNESPISFPNGQKPIALIKRLIRSYCISKQAIILDFFAGSGTTGHAVMDLNKEDGGNRHFILCTNNEVSTSKYLDYIHSKGYMEDVKACGKSTQSKINKFFEDNPDVYKKLMVDGKNDYETYGICQSVTFPRLNTVITGIRPDGTKYSDGIEANLRYFQTDMIAKSDEDLDELLYEASFCLAELDCMSRIDGKTICIAECDEDVDDIIQNATDDLKIVFVAYDVFFDTEQQEFFDRHHIEIKRIPDCFYTEY